MGIDRLRRGGAVADQHRLVRGSTAGMPWLPRTRFGSSGTTSNKCPEPQLLPRELQDRSALGPEQFRVEKQLARVVAGLAVNVDRAGEIRGEAIVEPVGISKPRIGLCDSDHQLAGIEGDRGRSQPRSAPAYRPAPRPAIPRSIRSARPASRSSASVEIDVRDLVIAHGEGPAAECVEHLTERPGPNLEQSRFAQHAIQEDRPGDVGMSVLAHDPHARPAAAAASRIGAQAWSSSPASRAMSQPDGPNR